MKKNLFFLASLLLLSSSLPVYVSPLDVAKPVGITAALYLLGGWTVGVPVLSLLRGLGTIGYSSYNFFKNMTWIKKWTIKKFRPKIQNAKNSIIDNKKAYGLTALLLALSGGLYFYITHSEIMKLWNIYKTYKNIF